MRLFGIALFFVGFLWIAWDGVFGLTSERYLMWISHSQNLLAGDSFSRAQVSNILRDMSLSLNRLVVLPAVLMLIGGLIMASRGGSPANTKAEVDRNSH